MGTCGPDDWREVRSKSQHERIGIDSHRLRIALGVPTFSGRSIAGAYCWKCVRIILCATGVKYEKRRESGLSSTQLAQTRL
jgi:hypothetical protein